MCGDDPDPTPHVNVDDVSKNALNPAITGSDGDAALKDKHGNSNALERVRASMEQWDSRWFDPEWPDHTADIDRDAVPPGVDEVWRTIGRNLRKYVRDFEQDLRDLKGKGYWKGETIDAAYDNAMNSTAEPYFTGAAALRTGELTRKFRETLNWVYDHLHQDPRDKSKTLWQTYQDDLETTETFAGYGQYGQKFTSTDQGAAQRIKNDYREYMKTVMEDSYIPGLTAIIDNYPPYVSGNAAEKPGKIPGLPETPGGPTGPGGGPSTGGGGGAPSFGGGGGSSIPKGPVPSLPEGLQDGSQLPGDPTDPGQSTGPGQNSPSLTDPSQALGAASPLASAAQQAMGAATQAAKAPPGGQPKGPGAKPKIPEGALQLGKGGPAKGAGAGGGSGGGASLGGAPKGLPTGLPGQPAAATQAAAAGASQPRIGAGASGMGPPGTPGGAGHGAGGAQQAKEHKVNKALRSRKTGAEIAGDAEAVVPVIGQDQDQDQGQDKQHDRQQRDRGQARHDVVRSGPPTAPAGPGQRGVRAH